MAKILRNKRDIIPPLDKPNDSLALCDVKKANLFSDYLEKNITPYQEINQSFLHDKHVNNFLSSPLHMFLPAKPVTPAEIIKV